MKKLNPYIFLLSSFVIVQRGDAQNTGIGTTNPQRTLHVAGDVRIDAFASTGNGLILTNSIGDLSRLSLSNNAGDVLKGDGTWGAATGIVASTGIVGTTIYNNADLLNAGFSLFGELPGILSYSTTTATFPANTWQPTYTRGIVTNVSAPLFPYSEGDPPLAIWSGSLMYVSAPSLYAYNPVTDAWSIVNNSGFSNGLGDRVVWTGTEIVYWSGQSVSGKKYNPTTNIWTTLPTANAPSSRYYHTMIWDGTRVIIWGGNSFTGALNTGAMYDPSTNTWTAMNNASVPSARMFHTAVWNNVTGRMIVWGGSATAFSGETNTGGLFDPVSNNWTGVTDPGGPSARFLHSAVWTGTEMIIFGGLFNGIKLNSGSKYNPSTNTWLATSTSIVPALISHAALWTGSAMVITGGTMTNSHNGVYSYEPISNSWTSLTPFSNEENKQQHKSFMAGDIILIWGGRNVTNASMAAPNWTNTGYRYFLTPTASSATTITSTTLYLYQKN